LDTVRRPACAAASPDVADPRISLSDMTGPHRHPISASGH
jgi:hypothetical protein